MQNNQEKISLTTLSRAVFEADAALKEEKARHDTAVKILSANLAEANRLYALGLSGIDVLKLSAAEKILYRRGVFTGEGAQRSVVEDFIKWVATGRGQYYNPTTGYYGTKNYSEWRSQREDHQYGYGPKHGSTNFALGLNPDYRSRELTDDEKDALIYYLGNISTIQGEAA